MIYKVNMSCLFLLSLSIVGCEGASTTVQGIPEKPAYLDYPLVDNPNYHHWKKFPVGTTIQLEGTSSNVNGTVQVWTVQKLAEITDDKAFVEQQVTVQRPDMPLNENPPMMLDYAATFRLKDGTELPDMSLPDPKAKEVGQEIITISDKDFAATIYEYPASIEGRKGVTKIWWSEDFPGRRIRVETTTEVAAEKSTEEVVKLEIPEKVN